MDLYNCDPLFIHEMDIPCDMAEYINTTIPFIMNKETRNIIIYGSYVLYLYRKFILKHDIHHCKSDIHYNDIDIFFNNKVDFLNTLYQFSDPEEYRLCFSWGMYEQKTKANSVIDIICGPLISDEKNYQFIYYDYNTIDDLFKDANLDYNQLGIQNNKIYITEQARVAIETGIIRRYTDTNYLRINKALDKGMKLENRNIVHILENENRNDKSKFDFSPVKYTPDSALTIREIDAQLTKMSFPDKNTKWYNFSDIVITGLVLNDKYVLIDNRPPILDCDIYSRDWYDYDVIYKMTFSYILLTQDSTKVICDNGVSSIHVYVKVNNADDIEILNDDLLKLKFDRINFNCSSSFIGSTIKCDAFINLLVTKNDNYIFALTIYDIKQIGDEIQNIPMNIQEVIIPDKLQDKIGDLDKFKTHILKKSARN